MEAKDGTQFEKYRFVYVWNKESIHPWKDEIPIKKHAWSFRSGIEVASGNEILIGG
jgi:hypothetical protein